jgi:hypothetical protein
MSKYKVYWNNVCLLSSQEESFIKSVVESNEYFPFEFEYFGLGKPQSMTQRIKEDINTGKINGDIIVSTDLDVFQNQNIAQFFYKDFKRDYPFLPIRDEINNANISLPDGYFKPFISIPLVIVVNKTKVQKSVTPKSLKDLLDPSFKNRVAFGGIHNSAGRSLLKSIWYLYGRESVDAFLSNAVITSMPALAFQKVRTGEVGAAIVPTIFALRKGIHDLEAYWPEEGAVSIPSYIAVNNRVKNEDFKLFADTILGYDHQLQLKNSGDIIPVHPGIPCSSFAVENKCHLLYPKWEFFKGFDHVQFEDLCQSYRKVSSPSGNLYGQ